MSAISLSTKITAKPGRRDELLEHILAGTPVTAQDPGCHLLTVNASITDPDVILLFQVFADQETVARVHSSSELAPFVQRAAPLVAATEATMFEVVGGAKLPPT